MTAPLDDGDAGGAGRAVPVAATALALSYLAAVTLPELLPVVAVAAPASACALVLTVRRAAGVRPVLAGLALWLATGLGGALWLAGEPVGGLAWVALALFLAPLPLIPWLYARTFEVAPTPAGGETPTPEGPAAAHPAVVDERREER